MTNKKQKKRAKVTGVTIHMVDSNGNQRTITIDPKITKALFWDDKSVLEILAPFYETYHSEMSEADITEHFGSVGKKVVGKKKKVKVTKDVVKTLWETEDETGSLPGLIGKTYQCLVVKPGGDD